MNGCLKWCLGSGHLASFNEEVNEWESERVFIVVFSEWSVGKLLSKFMTE